MTIAPKPGKSMGKKIYQMSIRTILALCLMSLCIPSCHKVEQSEKKQPVAATPVKKVTKPHALLENDNIVLAKVNNIPITQYDLEQTIKNTFNRKTTPALDEKEKQTTLQSMVLSRAMAQLVEKEMTATEKAKIDKMIIAYKEQLLVKYYLQKHVTMPLVTQQMVETYYDEHSAQFGGQSIRYYELLCANVDKNNAPKKMIIDRLKQAALNKDWQQYAQKLDAMGLNVAYQDGQVKKGFFNPGLEKLMDTLSLNNPSEVTLIQGIAYIVKITEEKKTQGRPKGQVSAQIRNIIKTNHLRQAIQSMSNDILAKVDVVYGEK